MASCKEKEPPYYPDMNLVHQYNRLKKHQKRITTAQGEKVTLYKPMRSQRAYKKLKVYVENPDTGKLCIVHFGHTDYEDYTIHNNEHRRKMYCARTQAIESNDKEDVCRPNFWSRMVLWNC
jgi:hypothetical protein